MLLLRNPSTDGPVSEPHATHSEAASSSIAAQLVVQNILFGILNQIDFVQIHVVFGFFRSAPGGEEPAGDVGDVDEEREKL